LIERFFSDDCSLGDKHFVITILARSSRELADNPKKYQIEKFNEYKAEEDSAFFF
jgi:hypothetical protein